ncbi:AHH domain-containing protein [Marinomonas spartinae]|uniref:AHH domain-containing protein n=1 Tax=Marinomonas spartinae TaxID=1792290 RepID=UPI0018F11BF9|nr:AHH domain-containing protein [Marinomonas spartinae]MBJ7554362.1 AHH domain-containing protein [Marinomonas spartinae]
MQPFAIYPQPDRPSNPTPLEMAIYNYELKAKAFYDKKAKLKGSKDAEVINRLNQDYNHLEKERKRLESITVIQESLDAYRAANELSDEETLFKENHHPTTKLARFLTAIGEPKPTVKHEAHHIIPGKGRFAAMPLLRARLQLHAHGIGINDPMNGVWLYGTEKGKDFDWATADTISHRRLHRHNYELWISDTLRVQVNKTQYVNLLRQVKLKIKMGTMPQNVMMPKNKA